MDPDCLFCKIVAGSIAAKRVYEDDVCLCFADVNPQAPTHLLLIPKEHIGSLAVAEKERISPVLGHLMATAADVARSAKLVNGYRIVANTGADGGQTVGHLHLHLLGGRAMSWPPG